MRVRLARDRQAVLIPPTITSSKASLACVRGARWTSKAFGNGKQGAHQTAFRRRSHFERRARENFQIQPEAFALDILEVEIDARLHVAKPGRAAARAIDLRPAGDAGLDQMAQAIIRDPRRIIFVMGDGVRARPHQRHVAGQDIQKLRQLIQAGDAQKFAHPGDARIALAGLHHLGAVLQHMHGAEFVDVEDFAVPADAPLAEEGRTRESSTIATRMTASTGRKRKNAARDRTTSRMRLTEMLCAAAGAALMIVRARENPAQRWKGIVLNAHGRPQGKATVSGLQDEGQEAGRFSAPFRHKMPVYRISPEASIPIWD